MKGWVSGMHKIAVLGDSDSICGFAALGLSVFPVSRAAQGTELLRKLAEEDYGVIYVTETLAEGMEKEIDQYRGRFSPAVVRIPEIREGGRQSGSGILKLMKQAAGSALQPEKTRPGREEGL